MAGQARCRHHNAAKSAALNEPPNTRLRLGSFHCPKICCFHLQDATPNMEIALGEGDFDPGFAEFPFDGKIEIAAIAAWPGTHLTAPDHQLQLCPVFPPFPSHTTTAPAP